MGKFLSKKEGEAHRLADPFRSKGGPKKSFCVVSKRSLKCRQGQDEKSESKKERTGEEGSIMYEVEGYRGKRKGGRGSKRVRKNCNIRTERQPQSLYETRDGGKGKRS